MRKRSVRSAGPGRHGRQIYSLPGIGSYLFLGMGLRCRAPYHHPHDQALRRSGSSRPTTTRSSGPVSCRSSPPSRASRWWPRRATARKRSRSIASCRPDIVLMDLSMPVMDGLAATKAIHDEFPDARVIVLTTYGGDEDIHRALDAGAMGYLVKDMVAEEVLNIIRTVHAGRRGIPQPIAAKLAEHTPRISLTPREIEVLSLVANGLSNGEVSRPDRADRRHRQGPPQEHSPEARRQRPDRGGDDGPPTRLHQARLVGPTSNVVRRSSYLHRDSRRLPVVGTRPRPAPYHVANAAGFCRRSSPIIEPSRNQREGDTMPATTGKAPGRYRVRPFTFKAPEAELEELRRAHQGHALARPGAVADDTQGVQLATMQKLARYWATEHDWRKVEAKLNSYRISSPRSTGSTFISFTFVRSMKMRCRSSSPTAGPARSSSSSRSSSR